MNQNKGLTSVIKRELRLLKQRKSFLLGLTVLPVVSLILLLAMFGGGELHDLPMAVVDHDNSTLSRRLIRMIDANAGLQVDYMPQTIEEAEQLMLADKVDGILYLPRNMQNDIYSTTIVKPNIYINATKLLNSSLVYENVVSTMQMLSVGIQIQLLTKSGKSPDESYELALPIYYEGHVLFNQYMSYAYYLITPFNMILVLIFAICSTVFSVGMEKKESITEQWLDSAGGSPYIAMLGKVLPYTVLYTLWAVICNFVIYGYIESPLDGSIWMMSLNMFLSIISYQAVGLLILLVLRKLMEALSISAALTTMSFTMGGLTFPLMAMHKSIFYFAHLFPYTYFMYSYVDITRGTDISHTLPYMSIQLVYVVIGILITPMVVKLMAKQGTEKLGI